jgi:hypothetical protein
VPSRPAKRAEARILGALDDPSEVAYAELVARAERDRNRQPGRISKRVETASERSCFPLGQSRRTKRLRIQQVEAEEIAAIVTHEDVLTPVESLSWRLRVPQQPPSPAFVPS